MKQGPLGTGKVQVTGIQAPVLSSQHRGRSLPSLPDSDRQRVDASSNYFGSREPVQYAAPQIERWFETVAAFTQCRPANHVECAEPSTSNTQSH